MTIAISSSRSADLVAAGYQNNPIIAWDNRVTGATLATATGTEVSSASYAATQTTYDAWIATPSSGAAVLHIDLGGDYRADMAGVASHNLADVSATVAVEYSTDNASWSDCGAGSVTPEDNQAIAWRFDGTVARYWRVSVSGATDDVELSVAFVGNSVIVPRRNYQGIASPVSPNIVKRTSNVSEGGHRLGVSAVRSGSKMSVSMTLLPAWFARNDASEQVWDDAATWDDAELWFDDDAGLKQFYTYANNGGAFFFAWRPAKYGDLWWAQVNNTLQPVNSGPKAMMSLDMELALYDNP